MKGERRCCSIFGTVLLLASTCTPIVAHGREQARHFNIPAQDLSVALRAFAHAAGQQILFDAALTAGKTSVAVSGDMEVDQALARLLAGSGLRGWRGATGMLVVLPAPAETSRDDADENSRMIIVTGTREPDKQKSQSVSPIDVVSQDDMAETGHSNLTDALVRLSPSITRPTFGHATGNLTNFISLRGLNPSQVLVLLNGKRRHGSALMNTAGSMNGSTPTDLDLIPMALVDRVEILRDGAGAQYGSDAIAGVANVMLNSADRGGRYQFQAGQYYAGDGFNAAFDARQSFRLGDQGFVVLGGGYARHDHSDRNDVDTRTGTHITKIFGDPASRRVTFGMNASYDLGADIQLYSFDTYAHRAVDMLQLYRLPNVLPALYPDGFSPISGSVEDNVSLAAGLRGLDLAGWNWDLSSSLGINVIDRVLKDSANLNLYLLTGSTPTDMDVGGYRLSQWTTSLDLSRSFGPGIIPFPLNVALGLEFRRESYTIRAGEPAAYEYGGGQSVGGIAPTVAGAATRRVYSGYVDLAATLSDAWQMGIAGRYEHYSDFGDTLSGKISSRYEILPGLAFRATLSNGVRAPSLANEFYSQIGNTPTTLTGVLAANSVAAQVLGARQLKPERATNITAGMVVNPLPRLDIVMDAYQIDIADRIASSPTYRGALAVQAFTLAGLDVDPAIPIENIATSYYTNAVDTRNRGVDVAINYKSALAEGGSIEWRVAFNYNVIRIKHVNTDINGNLMLNAQTRSYITTASPRDRLTAGARWRSSRWTLGVEGERYGRTVTGLTYRSGPNANSNSLFEMFVNEPRYLVNVDLGLRINKKILLTIGANNLLDTHPSTIPMNTRYYGVERYNGYASQIGINGGYYYSRISMNL